MIDSDQNRLKTQWASIDDCNVFANCLADEFRSYDTLAIAICLDGTLGAGKTQLVKCIAVACGANPDEVTSPTFVLVHVYETVPKLYHLDAYRINDEDEFLDLGIEEFFEEPAVTIVEWGAKFLHLFPRDRLQIGIDVDSPDSRILNVSASGPKSLSILDGLHNRLIGASIRSSWEHGR